MKITITEIPEKHPKLISMFEDETGKKAIFKNDNKITKQFIHWLRQEIKYKNLTCYDPTCPKFGQEFPSKKSLVVHKNWHNKEFRENHSGKNHWTYGEYIGEKSPNWKGDDVGYGTIHDRVRKTKPIPPVCDYCHKIADKNGNIKLVLSNIRNHQYTDNPDDYQYVHYSCHIKYDKKNKIWNEYL